MNLLESTSMKKNILTFLGIAIIPIFIFLSGCQQQAPRADLILKNGVIFTLEKEKPLAQALAIRGDRILAVGDNEDMNTYNGDGTNIIDLKGRFACPGFNDAHLQSLYGHIGMMELDLTGVSSRQELRERIWTAEKEHRRKVDRREAQPDDWLIGYGWDQSLMEKGEWPQVDVFRGFGMIRPAILYRKCGHAALVNYVALKVAQIDASTPDPQGGEIMKNPRNGRPTGILKEGAMKLVEQFMPRPLRSRLRDSLIEAMHLANRYGITSLQGEGTAQLYEIYHDLDEKGELTCRINIWSADIDTLLYLRKMASSHFLRSGLLYLPLDGGMGTHSAAMLWPYLDNPHTRGILKHDQTYLNNLAAEVEKLDIQIAVQAIGDNANRMAAEAFRLAKKLYPRRDLRYRVEHAQVLLHTDIIRLGQAGAVVSMQPFHCIDDMRWIEKEIGAERCRYAYAWHSFLDAGVPLAFGSYWPVAPLNPMTGIYAAITRRDTTGIPPAGWHPEERISLEEAIRAYTRGSAYAEKMDSQKGTLKVGKLADIVVLDRNLLTVPPQELLHAKVVYTFVGGKLVYSLNKEDSSDQK